MQKPSDGRSRCAPEHERRKLPPETWPLLVLAMNFAKICSVMPSEYDRLERCGNQAQRHEQLCERCGRELGRQASVTTMSESEALIRGIETMERRGEFQFSPDSWIRGRHPESFSFEEIKRMTPQDLEELYVTRKILEAARFVLGVVPDVA